MVYRGVYIGWNEKTSYMLLWQELKWFFHFVTFLLSFVFVLYWSQQFQNLILVHSIQIF